MSQDWELPDEQQGRPALAALVAFGLALAVFLLCRLAFVSLYEAEDDIIMKMHAAGVGVADEPSPFLMWSHYAYGKLLASLYRMNGDVNWYGVAHALIHLLAVSALCFSLLRLSFRRRTVLLLLLFLVAFDIVYWRIPQFTVTAFLAAMSGVFVFLGALQRTGRISWPAFAFGLFMIVLATFVRDHAAALALLVTSPVFVAQLIRRRDLATLGRVALFCGLAGSLVLGLTAHNRQHYENDPSWAGFWEFNSVRGVFHDTDHVHYTPATRPVFDDVGWSRNDFEMLTTWFYTDPERFSLEKMKRVVDGCKAAATTPSSTAESPSRHGDAPPSDLNAEQFGIRVQIVRLFSKHEFPYMVAALLVALFYVRWNGGRLLFLSCAGLSVVAITLLLVRNFKLPPRVLYPLMGFSTMSILFCAIGPPVRRPRWPVWARALPLALFAFVAIPLALLDHHTSSRDVRALNAGFSEAFARLDPDPGDLYALWGPTFPLDAIDADSSLAFMRDFKCVGLWYEQRHGPAQRRLAEYGIDDLYRALYERDNVFLMAHKGELRLLFEYVREHYDVQLLGMQTFHADLPRLTHTPPGSYHSRDRSLLVWKLRRFDTESASAEQHVEAARILVDIGDRKGAIACYRKAVEQRPDQDAPRAELVALLGSGRFED